MIFYLLDRTCEMWTDLWMENRDETAKSFFMWFLMRFLLTSCVKIMCKINNEIMFHSQGQVLLLGWDLESFLFVNLLASKIENRAGVSHLLRNTLSMNILCTMMASKVRLRTYCIKWILKQKFPQKTVRKKFPGFYQTTHRSLNDYD